MASYIGRRELLVALGAAAVCPLAAWGQQRKIPVIGFLSSSSASGYASYFAGFSKGLNESGYIEGRNVAIEYRWADGKYDRLPALAADLVRSQVAVIAASGTSAPGLAARRQPPPYQSFSKPAATRSRTASSPV